MDKDLSVQRFVQTHSEAVVTKFGASDLVPKFLNGLLIIFWAYFICAKFYHLQYLSTYTCLSMP